MKKFSKYKLFETIIIILTLILNLFNNKIKI
jgi:hypothetical protein